MDRLTEKTIGCFEYDLKNHKHVVGEFSSYDTFYNYSTAVKRLGQYEDTGFTPEEINSLRSYMGAIQDDHLEQESRIECKQLELDSLCAQLANTQARLAEAVGVLEKWERLSRMLWNYERTGDAGAYAVYTKLANELDRIVPKIISSPTAFAAGKRMRAMEAVVDIAHDAVADFEETIVKYPNLLNLAVALKRYDGVKGQ